MAGYQQKSGGNQMLFGRSYLVGYALSAILLSSSLTDQAFAQIFGGPGSVGNNGLQNTVDFDLLQIIQCQLPVEDDEEEFIICNLLLPDLIDQLLEAEAFLDQVFVGYRNDIPSFIRRRLLGPVRIEVVIGNDEDGQVGGTLAVAGPISTLALNPNPFLRRRGGYRAWAIPRAGRITLDLRDIVGLVVSESMVDVAVHEAFHALGHPSAFVTSGLNGPTNIFGQVNFLGDPAASNNVGFGLVEFRGESGNPFAQFIPLSQEFEPGARGGHLSTFEPTFNRPDEGIQEVFLPFLNGNGFMSRSLRGMFADLGYKIRGINVPGIIDIDRDGIDDEPLIVNPTPTDDP